MAEPTLVSIQIADAREAKARRDAFAEAAKYARSMETGPQVLNESYVNGYNDACKDLAGEYKSRTKGGDA